jgi:cbb3-type cytochrome oxidase subunit 1
MNVSRGFLVIGPIYLAIGIMLGSYMGATNDHALLPVHAHLNLLGFTLMMVFGLAYHLLPEAGGSGLARVHFWLHQAGTLVIIVMITLLFSGKIGETAMFPVEPIAELAVLVGVLIFALAMFRHAR